MPMTTNTTINSLANSDIYLNLNKQAEATNKALLAVSAQSTVLSTIRNLDDRFTLPFP
jgi:hypothetical protein